jgi:hypothetical protein
VPAKNRCNTCDQLGSELLQLAYEHLKAEQRLMEATLVSRDPVLTSAAAMAIPVILRKRGDLLRAIEAHQRLEHGPEQEASFPASLLPSFSS